MKIILVDKQEKIVAGMGVYSKELIDHLEKEGHDLIPLRFGQPSKEDPKDTIYLPYYLGDKSTYFFIPSQDSISIINEALKKEKPDVVHINLALSPLDFVIPNLCHRQKIPIVGIFHGAIDERITPFSLAVRGLMAAYLPCFKQLDRVISFSEGFKNVLGSLGVNKDRIDVLPNAVDTKKYSPGPSKYREKNGNYVLFLGRMDPVKNPGLLIEMFLKINPNNLKLVLVGTGTQYKVLEETYRSNKNIVFTGPITETSQKVDIMRGAMLYVLPSTFEGLSLALLENMSVGTPVIATDAGAHAEVLKNYPLILHHEKVGSELEESIRKFLNNPGLQKEMAEKSRRTIFEDYSFTAYNQKIISIYKKAIRSFAKNPPKIIDVEKSFPTTTKTIKKLSSLAKSINRYFAE